MPDPTPTLGRIVHYRGKKGRHAMYAAIVTGTTASLHPDGVAAGDVPPLDSNEHVHLWVFSPAAQEGATPGYPEFNIPRGESPQPGESIQPGSWCWPERA